MYQAIVLLSAALLVGVDQLTKWLAIGYLKGTAPAVLIDGVLELHYTENTGIAWGMLQDKRWLVTIVTSVVLLFLLFILLSGRFRSSRLFTIGGTMVAAGGVGNLLDRVVYSDGHVVDFISFKLINFPIFNVADCCVVIGAILILIYFFFFYTDKADRPLKPITETMGDTDETTNIDAGTGVDGGTD